MGSGGGSTSGKTDFPDYMKIFHAQALYGGDVVAGQMRILPTVSAVGAFNIAVAGNSPYYNFTTNNNPVDKAFLATGLTVDSYTKVFDLLKSFQLLNFDTKRASVATGIINDISISLDDDININILPKFKANLRGMGAIMSSAYVIGETLIWDSKIKALAKERLAIEDHALKVTLSYLDFQKQTIQLSADILRVFYTLKNDVDTHYAQMGEHDMKWDLEMFQYLNNTLASISGAAISLGSKKSQGSSAIGGALSGAAMGAGAGFMMGGPVGAAIGGVAGGLLGLAGGLS